MTPFMEPNQDMGTPTPSQYLTSLHRADDDWSDVTVHQKALTLVLPAIRHSSVYEDFHAAHHSHFHRSVPSSANDFICHKVYAIDLVRMSWQISFDFVRLQVPDLRIKIT